MLNKFSFLCFLLAFSTFLQAKNYANLYEKLVEVNAQWQFQQDLPKQVFAENALLDENKAIQMHLQLVEQTLRKRDISHLSPTQQKNRLSALTNLHGYWKKSVFPKNEYLPYRNPVFIDKYNTFCAVGYLVKMSGNEAVSREIAATQNFAYLYEIQSEKIVAWAQEYGFTLAELAWIQPGYPAAMPTQAMRNGVGGTVYDMMMGTMGTDLIHVAGDFPNGVSTYSSGFAGYDWFMQANITGGNVYALAYWNNMPVYGGNFTAINGISVFNIAQFNLTGMGFSPMGTLNGVVKDLLVYNNNLYAAGSFGLAIWNGNEWINLGETNGIVNCLYEWKGDLYLGGDFTQISGQSCSNVVKFNTGTFSAIGNQIHLPVHALCNYEDTLYIGGDLHQMTDTAQAYGFVWRWDNTSLDSISLAMKGHAIYAFADAGTKLYVGGSFSEAGLAMDFGKNLARIEKYGAYHAAQMIEIFDAPVYSLKTDNNVLYVGGAFTSNYLVNNFGGIGNFTYQITDISAPSQTNITVFPNPTADYIEIKDWEKISPQSLVIVRDMMGKTLYQAPISAKIDLSNLPSGTYILQIENGISKIVKQ